MTTTDNPHPMRWYRWPAEDRRVLTTDSYIAIEAWRNPDNGELRWLEPGGNPNNRQYTDEELAEIKREREITIGDWQRMTPAQRLADLAEWWAALGARGGNIGLIDPLDPMNARRLDETIEE